MNNLTATQLLTAQTYKWKGGLPLPNGYEVLDKDGTRLMLFFSEDQAETYMSFSAIIKSSVGKYVQDMDDDMAAVVSQYLPIVDGYFVEPFDP